MQYVEIKGKPTLCYVIKRGEANDVVIPAHYCAPVDLRRLSEIEAKGGEMLARMRDHTIDNGINALVQYESLFVIVPKPKALKKKVVEAETTDELVEEKPETFGEVTPKRRAGRPRKQ